MIYEWQAPHWQRVLESAQRMPHALLFGGPAGGGKRHFAEALAARVLCAHPRADGHACGECEDCRWRLGGNHPDLLRVIPAADQDDPAEGGEKVEKAEGKAASRQIVIDQIRALQQALTTGGHRGGKRVAIVDPAEAMNLYTANALLKLLEEPTTSVLFLLISAAPKRLLPTIRSRCQGWSFPRPAAEAAARWLEASKVPGASALLAFSGGMPLAAAALAEHDGAATLKRFLADISSLPGTSPLRLAADWEAWLKAKDSTLDMPTLVAWLQRWIADLASLRLGGPLRFFPGSREALAALAGRMSVEQALDCYNAITQARRIAQHPLNARLFLEDMLLRYTRSIAAGNRQPGVRV